MDAIFPQLLLLAEDTPEFARARVVACVALRGRPISFGFGHNKTHPFQARYGKNSDSIFWHAETHAIFNALKKYDDLSQMEIFVLRLKSDRKHRKLLGLSKPCAGCQRCIDDHNLKAVHYTEDGAIPLEWSSNYEI